MKRYILALTVIVISLVMNAQDSDILMTLGKNKVTKDDFEYLFLKNRTNVKTKPQTIDEYLQTYKKFRLKVIDAEALGYDTLGSFRKELDSYRNQMAIGYLTDKDKEKALIEEAYRNMQQDVEASHILLLLPQNATPEDTAKIYQKALNIIKRLKKENFRTVATAESDDVGTKGNGGYLGWITGQMMVYPVEKELYSLPIGKISSPIRTGYGYHIIKVTNRRQAVGKVKVAHILKQFPENATKEQKAKLKSEIDAIYDKLKNGADFASMAKESSDDEMSANSGGVLNEFGVGRMVEVFENTAFSLKNKGDISSPIETPYGWHIIQLIDRKPVDSFEKMKSDIITHFGFDGRYDACKKSFVDKLKNEYDYKFNQDAYKELIDYARRYNRPDSNYLIGAGSLSNDWLIKIKDLSVSPQKYVDYVYSMSKYKDNSAVAQTHGLINSFIDDEIIRFEDSRLEQKYPEFRHLIQEYHDGILLFNISNDKVWEKAIKDTAGLKTFFEQNIKRYAWQTPHYKGKIIYCKDPATAKTLQKKFKKMTASQIAEHIASLNKDSVVIKYKSGLWEKGENPVIDNLAFGNKAASYQTPKEYPYIFVAGKVLKSMPETYTDVRAAVVTDYQDYLEKSWIADLEKRYPATVDTKVLERIKETINK